VPVKITPLTETSETLRDPSSDRADYYVATLESGSKPRSYTGLIVDLTWLLEEGPCLYVGDVQAGPIREVSPTSNINGGVVESFYFRYIVSGPFKDDFMFGKFDESICMKH
jgi:hypothetical protein